MVRRRAVVAGCNYPSYGPMRLYGSCNDAQLMAASLVHLLGTPPSNVLVLTDSEPDLPYRVSSPNEQTPIKIFQNDTINHGDIRNELTSIFKSSRGQTFETAFLQPISFDPASVDTYLSPPELWPTKQNLLRAAIWLLDGARSGDSLLFYFSGHGLQVDDMSGYEGEGYDEAILPAAFQDPQTSEWSVLMCKHLRQFMFSRLPKGCDLTVIFDVTGGQTAIGFKKTPEKSGIGFIDGLKIYGITELIGNFARRLPMFVYNALSLFSNPSQKMERTCYDSNVWTPTCMQTQGVRPRYMPLIQIESSDRMLDPFLMRAASLSLNCRGYGMHAATWGTTAIEATFPSIQLFCITKDGEHISSFVPAVPVVHGVLTYTLVIALSNLVGTDSAIDVTVANISKITKSIISLIKRFRLPKLDQKFELTTYSDMNEIDSSFFGFVKSGPNRTPALSNNDLMNPFMDICTAWKSIFRSNSGNGRDKIFKSSKSGELRKP